MNRVKKSLENQALGLLPLLLFIFLDNFFSYLLSYIIGVAFCLGCVILFQLLKKDKVYLFMLLPAASTMVLYSIFLILKLEPVLYLYSPLVTELLLVVSLTMVGFTKRSVLHQVRNSNKTVYDQTTFRTTLNEFYFLAQLVQNIYTLHLFGILLYSILPETMQSMRMERFLYRDLGLLIGLGIILYEHIRLRLMKGRLQKEMWIPVLNEKSKVVGCIARSVSRTVPKKYYHPIVRIAVVYQGMLYLTQRGKDEFVSPNTQDYPFYNYVLFRHSIKNTVKETLGSLAKDRSVQPRFLIRYTFEDEKVKHLVSLHVICLHTEEQMNQCKNRHGKLWTVKQIQDNLKSKIFSEYFEIEFPYLQNTILLAENYCKKA